MIHIPLRRHHLIILIGILIGVGLFLQMSGAFSSSSKQRTSRSKNNIIQVETVIIGTQPIEQIREAIGTARAFQSIQVTTKVSGIIESIHYHEGQKVKQGDILVQFDRTEKIAEKEKAQAELIKVKAQREEAFLRLERATSLRRTGSGTAAQVEDFSAQVKALDGAIASAKASLKMVEARLNDLIITAPFSGHIGSRNISVGSYLSPGDTITTLDDLSIIRIDFSVPENLLGQLKQGQIVRAYSAAYPKREFSGKVSVIDTRVDPVSRSVRLTADFENPDEALKTGMFLSVRLEISLNEKATVIPEEALLSDGMQHLAYIVTKDQKAERRVVKIGQRKQGIVEILEGLTAGEQLVLRGLQRVRPNMEVLAVPVSNEEKQERAKNSL